MEYYLAVRGPLVLVLCAFLFSSFLIFISILAKKRRSLPFPPGPPGYPIIGHMHWMDQLKPRGLAELGKLYGGVVHLRLGTLNVISVTSPDTAHEVLQVQDHIFSDRPTTVAIRYLTYDRSDMVFANCGPFWRQMRKIFVMRLFSRKWVESWTSVRDEVDSLIRAVHFGAGQPVNLGELLFNMTRNITFRAAFGSSLSDGQEEFVGILMECSKLMGAFNIVDLLPGWLRWVDPQGFNKRLQQTRAAMDRFIDPIMDRHMTISEGNKGETDMVDVLISLLDDGQQCEQRSDGPQGSIKLTKNNLKAIISDVMFGGTETVASTIEWTMAELFTHPEELAKMQAELERVVGSKRVVYESDLDKLSYLRCIVKETFRLHPPIPLLLHKSAASSTIGGYFVPAGAHILVNVWALGRDQSAWDDPNTFIPERFLNDEAPDFKGNHFELIPFGSGRRSCPGMHLGLHTVKLAVAQLVHCFSWSLPGGLHPSEMDMSDVFGLAAPRAQRLLAIPTPRLQCSF